MSFKPILVKEIELSQPLKEISSQHPGSQTTYGAALLVVRMHNVVIGTVEVPFDSEVLKPDEYAGRIWSQLGEKINLHLEYDGNKPISGLSGAGVQTHDQPWCLSRPNTFFEDSPFVSVVVCTHDRTGFLRESLPHLLNLNYPNYEVIVVDNAPSTSETYDYVMAEYGDHKLVHYVREDQAGLSWARNCGIRHSRGEYIAFTDDDAFADPDWLAYLMPNFFGPFEVACVTGLALPLELEYQAQVWFEQFGGLGNGYERLVFDLDEYRGENVLYPYTVGQYGAGVNMVFRADVLRKLGGFVVQINQADDISMFTKLITNGYMLVYDPKGFVYHKHRQDYEGLRRQIYNYGVGLSHFLIYLIVSDWTWLFKVAPRIPAAILHMLSPKSYKNENKQVDYPSELTWLERKGLLAGPIKYWQYTRKIRGLHSAVELESI